LGLKKDLQSNENTDPLSNAPEDDSKDMHCTSLTEPIPTYRERDV